MLCREEQTEDNYMHEGNNTTKEECHDQEQHHECRTPTKSMAKINNAIIELTTIGARKEKHL